MTIDSQQFLCLLEQQARRLVSDYAIGDALHDLAEGISQVLEVTGAGVALADDDHLSCAVAHPDQVATVERIQERIQQGPSVTAYRSGSAVTLRDIRTERDRWPQIVDAAEEAGLRAVAAIPVHLNGTRLGALDLYAATTRDWTPEELRIAEVLAAITAALIANAHRLDEARSTTVQLQQALDTRIVIEQAKGMIASQHEISVDEAFERLRTHARIHQLSLRPVAEAVVNFRLTLDRPQT